MKNDELLVRKILSNNIQLFRKKKGISQEKLGELSGLHRTFIGSIERCERNVSLSTLIVIANALGVQVSKLLEK